jgi:hypothetical protein
MYATLPTTGKMMCSGTVAAKATAEPTARPIVAARTRNPRAVVRWRLMRGRALRFALEGWDGSRQLGASQPQ